MENVHDWCISRQLWWGHRIPAWYLKDTNEYIIAETESEAIKLAYNKYPGITISDLKQDEDVLDTWFSSWLWPISVFNGICEPENKDIKYYYPTNDLITAPEILFFWVARMIIAGYEFAGEKPFKNVYLTGIVRDKLGRKMSKSLGNSPDPIDLMNEYGADGVRVGMLLCSPAGNDLPFDISLPEQGRNFGNKIWNAFRLILQWEVDEKIAQPEHSAIAVEWLDAVINKSIESIDDDFSKYRISEALMEIYKLFWDEFSAWYLEIIKPAYQQPIDGMTYKATLHFFDKLLHLLHPFMPFITEEIWQYLEPRKDGESIMISKMPEGMLYDSKIINDIDQIKQLASNIRTVRSEKGIPVKEQIGIFVKPNNDDPLFYLNPVISKLCNAEKIEITNVEIENSVTFMVKTIEYFIPLGSKINVSAEIEKLKQELEYLKGFLRSVSNKLSNEKFMANAPENVVKNELAKKSDAETKIKSIENQIQTLTIKQT